MVASVRPATGTRQVREASLLVSCRTSKFQKNNYKWVAASEKSPRVTRRVLRPRTTMESVNKAAFGTVGKTEKSQPNIDPEARPEKLAPPSKPGASPSKYKWKASSLSASSSSTFCWQSEAGSKDHTSQLSPVPSRPSSGDRPAGGASSLTPLFGESRLSAYKVTSLTKIIRRRGKTSLPGDKKNSPSTVTTSKNHLTQRRRQVLQGKKSPILRKTPHKVNRHRLCCMPFSRTHQSIKEASNVHMRIPPSNKVIKTRYRIVKKTPSSPFGRLDPATTCSRSLAIRAIQRSLAIIWQVRQKKEKKRECCMYSNHFGRCNRGECCPYIHDPEKVAVCTRFVRGMRKKTDGSRPFSHHMSKEKMPVCSYFLKGICSNSKCPYSHMYVSRKAEVCSDFLKGYCPLGAKCKKKHTLPAGIFVPVAPSANCSIVTRSDMAGGQLHLLSQGPVMEPPEARPQLAMYLGSLLLLSALPDRCLVV